MTRNARMLAGLGAACLTLGAAAQARADSVVFIKQHQVWVANPDGSGARPVTSDGTETSPYSAPSQADDGTIAAAKLYKIVLLHRDGTKLGEIDPPALTDSASQGIKGVVIDAAISPDASKVAYSYARYSCPAGASCTTRYATGYVATAGASTPDQYSGGLYVSSPSWVTNSRTLLFNGFGHQVNIHDLGPGTSDVHWFDDADIVGFENSTDLDDGELNRQGTKLALIRSYGSTAHMVWYAVNGNALTGAPPADPTMVCGTGSVEGIESPTWAPDGNRLAWGEPDGIWTLAATTLDESQCAAVQPVLTIPGGSEPDWGPADIGAPKPPAPVTTPGSGTPAGTPPATTPPQPAGDAVQQLVTVDLPRRLRLRGFTATVTPWTAGKLRATVKVGRRTIMTGAATATKAGDVRLRLKRTKAGKRFRKRRASARLAITFTPSGGKAQTIRRTIKLVR